MDTMKILYFRLQDIENYRLKYYLLFGFCGVIVNG